MTDFTPPRLFTFRRGSNSAAPVASGPNSIVYNPGPETLWMLDRLADACDGTREYVVGTIILDWLYDHCGPGPMGYDPSASDDEKRDWFYRRMFRDPSYGPKGGGSRRAAAGRKRQNGRGKKDADGAAAGPRRDRR